MSRIHEALRKAAQERAESPIADASAVIVASQGAFGAILNESPAQPARGKRTSQSPIELSFDEISARCIQTKWKPSAELELSRRGENGKIGAEGFRTLRSRLYQISDVRPPRRVLITSSLPAEGKTFVATNLVLSIVRQPERRVLLIDADLRAGGAHTIFGVPNSRGLSDYLRGDSDELGVIQNNSGSNLCFISSGSSVSNPSELLLNGRLKTLLSRVSGAFDWVILDSPPILAVHDPSSLADLCDGVLLVVRAGATSHDSAKKSCSEFRNKNLLGIVLNHVDRGEMQDSYCNYYSNKGA
jgi:capsular exopolysaccharide synthesis family protein